MFAVIKTGGKQYKVSPGDKVLVEKLEGDVGKAIHLKEILMVGDEKSSSIGTPFVDKSEVKAKIIDQTRGDKIIIFKKKRRQNYRRKKGHKQHLTCLWIEEIVVNGVSHAASKPAPVIRPKVQFVAKADADQKTAEIKKPRAKAQPSTTDAQAKTSKPTQAKEEKVTKAKAETPAKTSKPKAESSQEPVKAASKPKASEKTEDKAKKAAPTKEKTAAKKPKKTTKE
jgi:large subunit ribosomal protein L21